SARRSRRAGLVRAACGDCRPAPFRSAAPGEAEAAAGAEGLPPASHRTAAAAPPLRDTAPRRHPGPCPPPGSERRPRGPRPRPRDTHYTSPSGSRDHGNYSTPRDLAALTRYAFRNPRFNQLVRTKEIHVRWAAPTNSKIYVNNNFLLHLYTGANGVKTGYTHESGWCLVATATRHGRRLIAVVLDSPNLYADARQLLNLGFSQG